MSSILQTTLVLKGYQHKIWESCGINYSRLLYKIEAVGVNDGTISSINGSWVGSPGENEIWETTSESINILNGLNLGNYKITFYGEAKHNSGSCTNPDLVVYDNNGGPNYVAYFTIAESNANTSISSDLSFTNFTVDSGVTLTIEKSGSLNISGTLTNNGAIVMNSASNEYSSLIAGSKAENLFRTYNKFISTVNTNDLILALFNGQTFADFYGTISPYAIYQNPTGGQTKVLFGRFNNDTGLYQNNDPSGTATMDAGEGFRAGSGIYKENFSSDSFYNSNQK